MTYSAPVHVIDCCEIIIDFVIMYYHCFKIHLNVTFIYVIFPILSQILCSVIVTLKKLNAAKEQNQITGLISELMTTSSFIIEFKGNRTPSS